MRSAATDAAEVLARIAQRAADAERAYLDACEQGESAFVLAPLNTAMFHAQVRLKAARKAHAARFGEDATSEVLTAA